MVLFVSEALALTRKAEEELDVWERKTLMRIYDGVKKNNGVRKRRTNQDIYNFYGELKLSKVIKARKMRWFGHILRK